MAIKVLELHHHAVRVGETEADAGRAVAFYREVLGLEPDRGRPYIQDIPGYWV
jgi:catechol 2,3-dioxygenase-like lactoylglutathione lyase family enzyme